MKLTLELIPKPSWGKNVRSMTSPEQWDMIRHQVYDNAKYACEICKIQTDILHAHEVWKFNMKTKIQTLSNIIALCEKCHLVKHFGYANISGQRKIALDHLMFINQIDINDAYSHINKSFDTWYKQSKINWEIDISYIKVFNKLNQE